MLFNLLLILIGQIFADDYVGNNNFTSPTTTNYRAIILSYENNIQLGILYNQIYTISFNVNSLSISLDSTINYYPAPLSSHQIIISDVAYIFGLKKAIDSNNDYFVGIKSDKTTTEFYNTQMTSYQHTIGLSKINNSTFILSYIDKANDGVILEFFINNNSFKHQYYIYDYYNEASDNSNKVLQCIYHIDKARPLCLAFNTTKYSFHLFDLITANDTYYIIKNNITQEFQCKDYHSSTEALENCDLTEIYFDLISISSSKVLLVMTSYQNNQVYLFKYNENGGLELEKLISDNTLYLYAWYKANYVLLGDDYFLISGDGLSYPILYFLYIPDMVFLTFPDTSGDKKYFGFDIMKYYDSNGNSYLLSFGASYSLSGSYPVYSYLNSEFSCMDKSLVDLTKIEGEIPINDLTEVKAVIQMCLYTENTNIQFTGFVNGSLEQLHISNKGRGCSNSVSYLFVTNGNSYEFRYYLLNYFTDSDKYRIFISSNICSFTLGTKCYDSCYECNDYGDETNHNCIQCKNGYYKLESTNNCFSEHNKPDDIYLTQDSIGNKIFKKCSENCTKCNKKVDYTENCIECASSFFFVEGEEGQCFSTYITNGMYYDNSTNTYRYCNSSCSQCTSKTNCTFCSNGYYNYDGQCYQTCPQGTESNESTRTCDSLCDVNCFECIGTLCNKCNSGYYSIDDIQCGLCYDTCSSCSSKGDSSHNNCLSCKNNLKLSQSNCVYDCSSKWYIDSSNIYHCVNECPIGYSLLVDISERCVSSCDELYQYYSKCYSICPKGTNTISSNKTCIDSISDINKISESNGIVTYSSDTSVSDFIDNLDNAVALSLSHQTSEMTSITTDELLFSFYPASTHRDIVLSFSNIAISLGECEDLIRTAYKINPDEQLYVGSIEMLNNSKCSYEIYDSNGVSLNTSVCEEVTIRETKKINQDIIKDYEFAQYMMNEQGINIYNESEPVFNDKCLPLGMNGRDLTLADRRNKVMSKTSLCSDNCNVSNVDFTTNIVDCDCSPQPEGVTLTSLVEENEVFSFVHEMISQTNLPLFLCVNDLKKMNKMSNNAGGIISIGLILLEAIFITVFLIWQITNIKIHIAKNIPWNPPKAEHNNLVFTNSREKINYQDITTYSSNSLTNVKNEEECNYVDREELNGMEYEEAKENDKRSAIRYYFDIASKKIAILSPILDSSVFRPISLKLLMFIFWLFCFLFVNALFFTEEYISNRFDSHEKLNFGYIVKHELQKSVLASLVALVVNKFFSLLTVSPGSFYRVIKESDSKDKCIKISNFVRKMKKKLYILFILLIIFSVIFFYFLFVFCFVYQNNQVSWIESSLISIVANILLYFILCLIITTLRYCALSCGIPLVYKIALFIYDIV